MHNTDLKDLYKFQKGIKQMQNEHHLAEMLRLLREIHAEVCSKQPKEKKPKKPKIKKVILDIFSDGKMHGGILLHEQLAERGIVCSMNNIFKHCKNLHEEGLLEKVQAGIYRLKAAPQQQQKESSHG